MAKLNNYSGSIAIPSGFKPQNNNDFPLLEAHSIQVDENGKRLDELLSAGVGLTEEQDKLLTKLSEWYDDQHYTSISIIKFTNTLNGIYEKGDRVFGEAVLAWEFNRTPTALTLDGVSIQVDSKGDTIAEATYTSAKTWTLEATGEKGETSSKSTGISFYDAIFYGVSASIDYDASLFTALTKQLTTSHKSSFTATAGANKYIYYCVPMSYRDVVFYLDGSSLAGGISKVADKVTYTKGDYSTTYTIYRSDYPNLGTTSVKISTS